MLCSIYCMSGISTVSCFQQLFLMQAQTETCLGERNISVLVSLARILLKPKCHSYKALCIFFSLMSPQSSAYHIEDAQKIFIELIYGRNHWQLPVALIMFCFLSIFLYSFPKASTASCYKFGSKQYKCIFSQFWRPDFCNQAVSSMPFLQRPLEEGKNLSLPAPVSDDSRSPLACGN